MEILSPSSETKKIKKSDKKILKSWNIIRINNQNNDNEKEIIKTNKSYIKQLTNNVLIKKRKLINENNIINDMKYYHYYQRSDFITNNQKSFRDKIMTKSQRIFKFNNNKPEAPETKNMTNNINIKSRQQRYRYSSSNFYDCDNKKIFVNKNMDSDFRKIQKLIYLQKNYQNLAKTQKFQLINTSYKITENRKNEINIKSPKNKELKEINPPKKRPHSIKYNHIKIKTNLKKLGNIFDINEVNVNKKIGEQVDKYIIGKILGKGAYATVNLATDKASKINYAMKIYKKRDIKDKVRKKCVDNEIEILKKIDHKNIIKLIEVIDLKDYILIIQELFMGISLGEYHKKYWKTEDLTKKKERTYKKILYQIFSAMNYLHKNSIAHLDIKMENILINDNLDIKIIDFGFAVYEPKSSLNKFFGGTPNYMSPEIIIKRPYISYLSDIWSLGVLIFKLFCNDYPFKGMTEKDLYNSIKKGKYRIKCYVNYDVKKIIKSMLDLDPNKRLSCDKILQLSWFSKCGK